MTRAVLDTNTWVSGVGWGGPPGEVDEVVELIALASHIVRPALTRDLVRDPDDNRVLEAAIAGNADVIVTGDADLLDLQVVERVRILTPADFTDELNP